MADLGAIGASDTVGTNGGGSPAGGASGIGSATSVHLLGEMDDLTVGSIIAVAPIFTFRPNTCTQQKKHRVLSATFGDGFEQRVTDGINTAMLEFGLSFENMPEDEGDNICDFLDARKGTEYFLWTPPRGTEGKYVCSEPIRRDWNPDVDGESNISVTFRQVFDL